MNIMDTLKVLDLFSGIGGFSLGLEWTGGFETIAFCDIDTYSQRLLQQNWKDVPVVSDIRLLSYKKGKLYYDGRLIYTGRIDVVTGGFPCQPFSTSGKRGGTNDDRYLWPEMLRIIEETKPTWVIGENVNGITSMGIELGTPSVESRSIARYSNQDFYDAIHARQEKMLVNKICEDVEQIGYEIQPLVIPACGLGAKHRRDRIWFLAYSDSQPSTFGRHDKPNEEESSEWGNQQGRSGKDDWGKSGTKQNEANDVANANDTRDRTPKCSDKRKRKACKQGRKEFTQHESCGQCENVGNSKGMFCNDSIDKSKKSRPQSSKSGNANCKNNVSNSKSKRIQGQWPSGKQEPFTHDGKAISVCNSEGRSHSGWLFEPCVGRVVNGFSGRVDRIKGLGNAVVPQIPYIIGYYILIIIKQKGEAQCQENQIGHLKK